MAFEQKVKIILTSFNPLWYDGALPECPDYTSISEWSSLTNEVGVVGSTEIGTDFTDDITGLIVRFSGHNKCYLVTDFDAGRICISQELIKEVADDETIYVYQWIDITDLQISVSNLQKETETDNYEFIFDSQMRFKAANYNEELYDRTAYETAFDTAQAYFNTRNENDAERDNKYVRIEAKYNDVWNQIYAGKITDDMKLDVANYEFEFEVESCLYSLKDIYLDQVEDIYNGHKYTSETQLTQTPSGKCIDIIWKMFREIGVVENTLTTSNVLFADNQITLTVNSGHNVQVGELIILNGDPAFGLPELINNTSHIVTGTTDTTITVSEKKFYESYDSDLHCTITKTNILFDADYTKYYSATQYNWTYDITDAWFIPQLWHKKLLADKTCNDVMNMLCGWFGATAKIIYKAGTPYGKFQSKIHHSVPVLNLTRDDFIGEYIIKPNWDRYSPEMVSASGTATYFDGSTSELGSTYYDDMVYGLTQIRIQKDYICEKGDTFILLDDGSSITPFKINDIIKLQKHSTEYRITLVNGAEITLNKPLEASVYYDEAIYLAKNHSIDLEFPELFYIKLIYPDIYCAVADDDYVHKYTNQATTINNYQDRQTTIYDPAELLDGISYLPCLPFYPMLSGQVFSNNYDDGEDVIVHGCPFRSLTDSFEVADITPVTSWLASGYVSVKDEETNEIEIFLTHYTARYDVSAEPFPLTYLYRERSKIEDGGEYSIETDYENHFGLYRLKEDKEKVRLTVSDVAKINGLALHSDIIHYTKNDYLYMTRNDNLIHKMLAYGSDDVANVFTDLPDHEYFGIHVSNYETVAIPAKLYVADRDDEIVYSCPLAESAWDGTPEAGGGVSGIDAGESCAWDDVLFDTVHGVWKCYDDLIIITDATGLYMLDNHQSCTIYKLIDSTYLNQVCAVDFVQVLMTSDSWDFFNIADNAAKNGLEYYGQRRREVDCELDWDTYAAYELELGDRLNLSSNCLKGATGAVNFWINKINLDLENRIIKLNLLEDTGN